MWIAGSLPSDVDAALQNLTRTEDVVGLAIMPDVHLAKEVCIGTVTATTRTLLPDAVGGDIGCGMSAIALSASAEDLRDPARAAKVLDGLYARVPVRHHARATVTRHPEELDMPLSDAGLDRLRRKKAPLQLGTLGQGNHFVEIQRDVEDDRLWVLAHSGSRGIGPAIRLHHRESGTADPESGVIGIAADTDAGRAYLADHAWARSFAELNRRALVDAVVDILADVLGAEPDEATRVDGDHNHVLCEEHEGRALYVHRKGAQRAGEGEPGIVPGSMGTATFHVEGRGHMAAYQSCAHGAGRVFSRGDARRRISRKQLREETKGVFFDRRLENRLRDEAPSAYKDIGRVMRAQSQLVRVIRRLEPVLVFKGV